LTRSELTADVAAANPQSRGDDVETIVATIFAGITGALARGALVDPRVGHNPWNGGCLSNCETACVFPKRQGRAAEGLRRLAFGSCRLRLRHALPLAFQEQSALLNAAIAPSMVIISFPVRPHISIVWPPLLSMIRPTPQRRGILMSP
jgi:hypothetical protein